MATITGTGGNDRLVGTAGADIFAGGAGNDTIYGGSTASFLGTGTGDDTLDGGDGNDLLYGGDGDDSFILSAGRDQYYGGDGIDRISFAGAASAIELTLNGFGAFNKGAADGTVVDRVEIVTGTGFGDTMTAASQFAATLNGGAGNDRLTGGDMRDRLSGDLGNDIISGNGGVDVIAGGAGNDNLSGGDQGDRLLGGGGNDFVYGGTGPDRIDGGSGNDRLFGEAGNDTLTGGAGIDQFVFLYDAARPVAARDVITDFDPAAGEMLMFTNSPAYDGFSDVMAAGTDDGRDTTISLFGKIDIVLSGVTLDELTAVNFAF